MVLPRHVHLSCAECITAPDTWKASMSWTPKCYSVRERRQRRCAVQHGHFGLEEAQTSRFARPGVQVHRKFRLNDLLERLVELVIGFHLSNDGAPIG